MVFKQDLTPIGRRGTIVKNRGKGATEQRMPPGGRDTLTSPASVGRMLNRYPKAPVTPPAAPAFPVAPPTDTQPPPITPTIGPNG